MNTLISPKSKKSTLAAGYSTFNPFLNSFNVSDFEKPKIKEVEKVISVASNAKSVSESEKLSSDLDDEIKNLPSIDFSKFKKLDKVLSSTNENIKKIDDFFSFLDCYEIDDNHLKKVMENLSKAKEKFSYLSDYLLVAKEVHAAKNEISLSKKKYTFQELKKKISVAK